MKWSGLKCKPGKELLLERRIGAHTASIRDLYRSFPVIFGATNPDQRQNWMLIYSMLMGSRYISIYLMLVQSLYDSGVAVALVLAEIDDLIHL